MSSAADDATLGFVRGPRFDRLLLFGPPMLGLAAVVASVFRPDLFGVLLTLDLALLGYHHVIATFTRTFMDRASFREHGRAALALFPAVAIATVVLGFAASQLPASVTGELGLPEGPHTDYGLWAINSVYLYWQWWHYTRQAYGVERIYARRAGHGPVADRLATNAMIYLVPAWAFLERIAAERAVQGEFLGLPVAWLPVPTAVAHAVGVVTAYFAIRWVRERVTAHRRGETTFAHTVFVASHAAMFVVAYAIVPVLDLGWLALNIWHNLQYLLIVWLFNANRFKEGPSSDAAVLSWLSQPRNAAWYVGALLLLTLAIYGSLDAGIDAVTSEPLWLGVVVFQTINFHHYVVDSFIWKLRRRSVRARLSSP